MCVKRIVQRILMVCLSVSLLITAPFGGLTIQAGNIAEQLNVGASVDEGLTLILPTSSIDFNLSNPDTPGQSQDVLPSDPQLAQGFVVKLGAQVDLAKKVALYVRAEDDNISSADITKVINIGNLSIAPHPGSGTDPNMVITKRRAIPGPTECNNFDGAPGGDSPIYGLRIYEQNGPGSSEAVYQLALVNSWNYQPGYYSADLTFTLVVE